MERQTILDCLTKLIKEITEAKARPPLPRTVSYIVRIIRTMSDDRDVLVGALTALWLMLHNPRNIASFMRNDGDAMLKNAMNLRPDCAPVQIHGCAIIWHLANYSPATRLSIIQAGGVSLVVNALMHTKSSRVRHYATGALWRLQADETSTIAKDTKLGLLACIAKAMA